MRFKVFLAGHTHITIIQHLELDCEKLTSLLVVFFSPNNPLDDALKKKQIRDECNLDVVQQV